MNRIKVICNTSPIIGLMSIDRLALLWHLFDKVYIPQAVQRELCANSAKHLQEIENLDYIKSDVDLLRSQGYRISDDLYNQILVRNNELK